MICPKCGPRDVVARADVDKKVHFCECDRCGWGWTEPYDPMSTPKTKTKEE